VSLRSRTFGAIVCFRANANSDSPEKRSDFLGS
jgi:hypothetical protein